MSLWYIPIPRYTGGMPHGVFRLAAGWGLIAVGAIAPAAAVLSRWWAYVPATVQRCEFLVSEGLIEWRWYVRDPAWRAGGFMPRSQGGLTRKPDPRLRWFVGMPDSDWTLDLGLIGAARNRAAAFDKWRVRVMLWPMTPAGFGLGVPLVRSGRRAWKRRRAGHCPGCGYELAGLSPGAPCPECGL